MAVRVANCVVNTDFSFKTWMFGVGQATAFNRAAAAPTRLTGDFGSRITIAATVFPNQNDATDAALDAD
jgi:hypothetical protein